MTRTIRPDWTGHTVSDPLMTKAEAVEVACGMIAIEQDVEVAQ